MINILWVTFIIIGIIYSLLTGSTSLVNNTILNSSKDAFNIFISIFPNIIFFSGIMNILNESGIANDISRLFNKAFGFLFKNLDVNDRSIGYISTALITNMIGMSNVSTVFSINAMKSLYKNDGMLNRNMITFLVLNITCITIIPTTIISLRNAYNSTDATGIVLSIIVSSVITQIISLLLNKIIGDMND